MLECGEASEKYEEAKVAGTERGWLSNKELQVRSGAV